MSFEAAIQASLTQSQKSIPNHYLYDARGCWLFQQIMQLPEYYLTSCETNILTEHQGTLLEYFQAQKSDFTLIDLGAGDASKTKILLEAYTQAAAAFDYAAVDLSESMLSALSESLDAVYPDLNYQCLQMDYWAAMEQLAQQKNDKRKVVLFLGANIGNFQSTEVTNFLTTLKSYLAPGDLVLIGFDLKKRPEIIHKAYFDSKGTTAAFNLNLLHRINRELGGNFKTNYFRFYPYYNPQTGAVMSYLVSQKEQTVRIDALNLDLKFEQWESIHTEIAKKYSLSEIEALAKQTGFQIQDQLLDSKAYFVNSLWKVA